MRKMIRNALLPLIAWMSVTSVPLLASVHPPLEATVDVTDTAQGRIVPLTIRTYVPAAGASRETRLTISLRAEGVVHISGRPDWEIRDVVPGKVYTLTTAMSVDAFGEGSVELHADSWDASDHKLWGRTDTLFILDTLD